MLGEQEQTVPVRVERGPTWFGDDPGRSLVTLDPGGSAYAVLAWGIMGPQGDGTCDKIKPTLQVTPPDEEDFLTTPLDAPVCRTQGTTSMSGTAYSAQQPAS